MKVKRPIRTCVVVLAALIWPHSILSAHDFVGVLTANGIFGSLEQSPSGPSTLQAQFAQGLSDEELASLEIVVELFSVWDPASALTVCFFDDFVDQETFASYVAEIIEVSGEWLESGGLQLDHMVNGEPRRCTADDESDIRVALDLGSDDRFCPIPGQRPCLHGGDWSFIGRSGHLAVPPGFPTLALELARRNEPRRRHLILHEFGHAFGFHHEHRSTGAPCNGELDWDAIETEGEALKWAPDRARAAFRQIQDSRLYLFGEYDPQSVMHYTFPRSLFKNAEASSCFIEEKADRLSDGDRAAFADCYPHNPRPGSDPLSCFNQRVSVVSELKNPTITGKKRNREDALEGSFALDLSTLPPGLADLARVDAAMDADDASSLIDVLQQLIADR